MKKSTKIIFICLIAMIFCTIILSMQLVGSAYARYKTKVSNSDNARVARFNITQSGTIFDTIEASIADTTNEVTLEITNDSEVTVEYSVTITNVTGNIPMEFMKFELIAKDGSVPFTSEKKENGTTILSACRMPGNYTDSYTLRITWNLSTTEEALNYMGMVDYITVSVTATQVD